MKHIFTNIIMFNYESLISGEENKTNEKGWNKKGYENMM